MIPEALIQQLVQRAIELQPNLVRDEQKAAYVDTVLTEAIEKIKRHLNSREVHEKSLSAFAGVLAEMLSNERNAYTESVGHELVGEILGKAFKEERALPIYFNDHGRVTIEIREKGTFTFTTSLEAIIRRSMESLSLERLNTMESVLIDALKQVGALRLAKK